MVYIEPVQLKVSTAGEQLSPTIGSENQIVIQEWSETYNWVLNKILSESVNFISHDDISETIESALDALYNPITEIDEGFAEFFKRRSSRNRSRRDANVVLYENKAIILPSAQQGQLYVVSEYETGVKSVVKSFNEKIAEFSSVASDFGIDVNILSGREFAELMSEELDAEFVSREKFDNTAEESVYAEIVDKLTTSVDSNITLRFGSDDPEVFEYDLLLHTGYGNRIVIEVKDSSREEADLDKNDLIDTPRDKTNIIKSEDPASPPSPFGRQERTEIFVVVKHMDSEDFEYQKQMADRRGIKLLRYENGNYINELENTMREMMYYEI